MSWGETVSRAAGNRVQGLYRAVLDEVGKVIVGQIELVEGVVVALFSEGSVLVEGAPGLGKTLLVNVLSRTVSCAFKRVQFTPDLMPTDLTGHSVYDMNERKFYFNPGPLFTNLLLADEINRSPPKTQSALLEVMQERQVTVDGRSDQLKRPFLVLATQNPLEHEGTYPLPEAQVDRFMFKLIVDYPTSQQETEILKHYAAGRDPRQLSGFDLKPVLQGTEVLDVQQAVSKVIVETKVIGYIAAIVTKSREWPSVSFGASPRSVNLFIAARTIAACRRRDFVTPDDVKEVAPWVLRHRIRLRPEAEIEGVTTDQVVSQNPGERAGAAVVIPRPRLVWLFVAAGIPLVLGVWAPDLVRPALLGNLVIVAAAIADVALTPPARKIEIRREVSEVLSVGVRHPVVLTATNRSGAPLRMELTDEPPLPSEAAPLPLRFDLAPWKEMAGTYELVPQRRGHHRFEAVHLRYPSRLGLWMKMERRPLETAVRIYPDIRAVREFDLLARKNRLEEMGLKAWRLRGRGGEFERLREYRREDELRHVDWKATAKHQKLVSREFNVERNQNIFFMLDCGRSMAKESEGLSHLDRGLNAAIILSYIALGQGDNVALMAFSNRIERAGPVRGKPAIQTLIRQTFDLEPRLEASDYGMACEDLLRRQQKRALVVLVTLALDEQHLLSIGRYVPTLVRPHILLCVFLKDVALTELARRVPGGTWTPFTSGRRPTCSSPTRGASRSCGTPGSWLLETLPQELSSTLINQYLDLKARHLL